MFAPKANPAQPQAVSHAGSFSGITNYRSQIDKADPKVLNKQFQLLWIGCGTEVSALESNKALAQPLGKNGVKHMWRETPGARVWPVWHQYLSEAAPLLFQNSKGIS
ncbi:MAG TPA: hypothetical protein VEQ63_00865 [Bryobacteraceae bacterium]|nr:hypothetical protein [Bryobacteraceae bacterium]